MEVHMHGAHIAPDESNLMLEPSQKDFMAMQLVHHHVASYKYKIKYIQNYYRVDACKNCSVIGATHAGRVGGKLHETKRHTPNTLINKSCRFESRRIMESLHSYLVSPFPWLDQTEGPSTSF